MERMTYAQAVGEAPIGSPVFFPGEDFDPWDEDDVAAVKAAGEIHRAEYVRDLEAENARLRAIVEGKE